MDLLIFGGQSNMEGRTEGLPVPNEAAPGVWEYKFLTDSIVPLVHPAGERILPDLDGASEGFGSLVPDFCRVYRDETGREVLAVHAAKGATRIDEWLPGTDRYRTALKKILGAKRAAGGKPHRLNMDSRPIAVSKVPAEIYLERLIRYKDALKRDAGIERFGIIRVGYFTAEHEFDEAIMTAQETACGCDPDFLMLSRITASLSLDPDWITQGAPGHFNNRGLKRIGDQAAHALAVYDRERDGE